MKNKVTGYFSRVFSEKEVKKIKNNEKTLIITILGKESLESADTCTKTETGFEFSKDGKVIRKIIPNTEGAGRIYAPGDKILVREAWQKIASNEYIYAADRENPKYKYIDKWRKPIFMPAAASRCCLSVTSIRIKRLMDIDEDDIKAAGYSSLLEFKDEWNDKASRRKSRSFDWSQNPWCILISFEKLPEKKWKKEMEKWESRKE